MIDPELERLHNGIARVKALLARMEWVCVDEDGDHSCPECGGEKPFPPTMTVIAEGIRIYGGHRPNCELAALLRSNHEAACSRLLQERATLLATLKGTAECCESKTCSEFRKVAIAFAEAPMPALQGEERK